MKIKIAIISIITAGLLCISCTAELAKSSETEILTFKIEEYPDQQIALTTEGITIQMPLETKDLRMTPIFTISRGATASPASGEKQDFGSTVKIGVTSEDNLYYSLYEVNVNYPHSSADFSTLDIAEGHYDYGTDFSMDFIHFPSKSTTDGTIKFSSFGKNYMAAGVTPDDKTLTQFYPAAAQKGKAIMVSTSYDKENAATIKFDRPVNIDTVSFTPSLMMAEAMVNGLTTAEYGIDAPALSSTTKDYMKICFAGYDKNGDLIAEKEFLIADFSYAPNTFVRTHRQIFNLLTSKIREVKELKIYLNSNRTDIPAVFFIDAISYKVLPQISTEN